MINPSVLSAIPFQRVISGEAGRTMLRNATGVLPKPSRYPPSKSTSTTSKRISVCVAPAAPAQRSLQWHSPLKSWSLNSLE